MSADIVKYPSQYRVLTPRTSLNQPPGSPLMVEVEPVEEKKPGKTWDRLSNNQKTCCLYGALFAILILGLTVLIICSVFLSIGFPDRSSSANAGKAFGIGLGAILAICAFVLILLLYCRRARKFRRATSYVQRPPPEPRPVVVREVVKMPPRNPTLMVVKEQAPVVTKQVVARPVVVSTTMQQPNTRPLTLMTEEPTAVISTRNNYVVASPIKSSPVVLFKKK